jgi:hypothetical protein
LDGTLTLGHTKEVDVLVLNRATGGMFRVEVKTSARPPRRSAIFGHCYTWLMDERHAHVSGPDLVYAFVLLNSQGSPTRFFLVPSPDVAAYIAWEYAHWRENSKRQTGKVTTMRVFRIPKGDSSCPVPPSWSDQRWKHWEDNWAIFGRRTGRRAVRGVVQ